MSLTTPDLHFLYSLRPGIEGSIPVVSESGASRGSVFITLAYKGTWHLFRFLLWVCSLRCLIALNVLWQGMSLRIEEILFWDLERAEPRALDLGRYPAWGAVRACLQRASVCGLWACRTATFLDCGGCFILL